MKKTNKFPKQSQSQPGKEYKMSPQPEIIKDGYVGSNKLKNKTAFITGGDSGIGRSIAVHFAREGANIAIVYFNEDEDALETKKLVETEGQACLIIKEDLKKEKNCIDAIKECIKEYGKIDVLVNNAAMQFPQDSLKQISARQLKKTFQTNIYSFFYVTKIALEHMEKGSAIINTSSVTAYRGSDHLLDYSSTKGAIVSFTRSLSANLAKKGIRVNGVAPGPIWTPLIPATFDDVTDFGSDTPMGRAGQPSEVAPAFVFFGK